MKKGILSVLALLLSLAPLFAKTVEIVSDMYTEEILSPECFEMLKSSYELRIVDQANQLPITTDYKAIERYIVFNMEDPPAELADCPSEKKVLFMMEPVRVYPEKAKGYARVYTWDDEMIDDKQYFKYYFPDLKPMAEDLPAFEERKLCTMIVRNWHAEHRKPIVAFFSAKPKGEFEFYGSPFPNLAYSKCYKGRIPGLNCGAEKIKVLKNYRFCFCFENTVGLKGYVTEKIFPCFAAGCVPIYWGAPNIEDYIPKGCYIDYRDFATHEELYLFIKTMPEELHEQYLDNIRLFLISDEAHFFSPQYFSRTLYEAAS